jgi:phage-related protein
VLLLAHAAFRRSSVKIVRWNEKARDFVRSLDDKTKIEIGTLLMVLQSGEVLGEPQSKPMKSIHAKAHELRVKDKKGTYRVIYVLSIKDQILIPHAFTKKTQKTSHKEIELAIQRLKEMLNEVN